MSSSSSGTIGRTSALALVVVAATAGAAVAASSPRAVTVGTMQNEFALDLYRHLVAGKTGDNLFFSPYSIYAALAMTAEGARGATADEMGRALKLPDSLRRQGVEANTRPWDLAPVHTGLGELAAALKRGSGVSGLSAHIDSLRTALNEANRAVQQWGADWRKQREVAIGLAAELNELQPRADRYQLRIANALWADAQFALSPQFTDTLAAHYGTGSVNAVDYRREPEEARGRINAWVAERTEQRVRDLLPPGSVHPDTRLVLTNAIWFKGEWAQVFDSKRTLAAPFQLADGSSAQVPLMVRELVSARYAAFRADGARFPTPLEVEYGSLDDPDDPKLYPAKDGFQIAALQYKGGRLSMVILLPRSPDGLAALERQIDAARLSKWTAGLERRSINVYLPRFRLEQGRELREPLEAMGMARAFSQSAQFNGMTSSTNPDVPLFLSAVRHQAFVEVNEKGTEAAAATGPVLEGIHVVPKHPFVPTFRADRPFLFLIRDDSSGAILFMGRFAKP